jgi:hypothetical protein
MHDLEAILKEHPADVILADSSVGAAIWVTERGGPPHAYFSLSCLLIRSRDTAPFGLAMPPDSSPLGRVRNRMLEALVSYTFYRQAGAGDVGRDAA